MESWNRCWTCYEWDCSSLPQIIPVKLKLYKNTLIYYYRLINKSLQDICKHFLSIKITFNWRMQQEMNGWTWQLLENTWKRKNTFLIEETWIIYRGCISTNIDIFLSIYHRNCLEAKLYKSSFMENSGGNYFLLFKIHLKSKELP